MRLSIQTFGSGTSALKVSNFEKMLDEQLAFYRDGVASYETWFSDVFDRNGGGSFGGACRHDRHRALQKLRALAPFGHALEFASGTGSYTRTLLASASSVTGVDASPESLAAAQTKLAAFAGRLSLVEADIFTWRPDRRYDTIFFSYWLSHVPPTRFEAFWQLVADALAPNGRVFFIDSNGAQENPGLRVQHRPLYREVDDFEGQVSTRQLNGRIYRVIKVIWNPTELESQLAELGWEASLENGALSFWGECFLRETSI